MMCNFFPLIFYSWIVVVSIVKGLYARPYTLVYIYMNIYYPNLQMQQGWSDGEGSVSGFSSPGEPEILGLNE